MASDVCMYVCMHARGQMEGCRDVDTDVSIR